MNKNNNYWRKRFEALAESQYKSGKAFAEEVEKIYEKAISSIEKDIETWYLRLAANNEITLAEAEKLLNAKELKEFYWNVEEYIEKGKENAVNEKWIKELENASARVHITRLESLKFQLQNQIETVMAKTASGLKEHLTNIYSNGYYKTIYEIQKGSGVGSSFERLNTNLIEKYINKPWAKDGRNFSSRIWGDHRPKLVSILEDDLTQAVIRGDDLQNVINIISDGLKVSKTAAGKLVMTETAAFSSMSSLDGFKQTGVKEFEVSAAFDSTTCSDCGDLDGTHYSIDNFIIGVTAPPFHCYCRCAVIPYFDDMYDITVRAARNEDGESYEVEGDITYNEWKERFVNSKNSKNDYTNPHFNDKSINEKNLKKEYDEQKEKFIDVKDDKYNPLYYDNIIKQSLDNSLLSKDMKELIKRHTQGNYLKIDIESYIPFYYNDNDRLIYINPNHEKFDKYDKTKSLLHELGHKVDKSELSILGKLSFSEKVQKQIKEFNSNTKLKNKYIKLLKNESIFYNMCLSDVLSAITKNEIKGAFSHKNDYWKKTGNKESEIFANIFSIICSNDIEIIELLKLDFPIIYDAITKILNL